MNPKCPPSLCDWEKFFWCVIFFRFMLGSQVDVIILFSLKNWFYQKNSYYTIVTTLYVIFYFCHSRTFNIFHKKWSNNYWWKNMSFSASIFVEYCDDGDCGGNICSHYSIVNFNYSTYPRIVQNFFKNHFKKL